MTSSDSKRRTGETDVEIPVIRYVSRSKAEEEGKDSTGDQTAQINARVESLGGRFFVGEPHIDHASGYKGNRGPGLAAAIESAGDAARRFRDAELWVWSTTRLGRGTGRPGEARAVGGLLYELRSLGVTVRSVEDDEFATNEILWGLASRMASKYSEDLGANVRRGMREQVERGKWRGGTLPDGYQVVYRHDTFGRVIDRELIFDPERKHIYFALWELAAGGMSAQAIEFEFAARGYLTAPRRAGQKPRPFDTNRILQALGNPFYAALVVSRGEVLPTPGQWPRYIEPEEFYRLRQERASRSHSTKRRVGRPLEGFVLAELARCGTCGDFTQGERRRRVRADGTSSRAYICRSHRLHHPESPKRCAEPPYDAIAVDQLVVSGIDALLTDADALREQLLAGRRSERERLVREIQSASNDADAAERAAEKAEAIYVDALVADDEEHCGILLRAVRRRREEARQALLRRDAAIDGIGAAANESEEDQLDDVMVRIWQTLSGRVADARADIKKLNAALREWFDHFDLYHKDGEVRVVPVLSADAVGRIVREPERWLHGSCARAGGYEAAVIDYGPQGGVLAVRLPASVGEEWVRRVEAGESAEDVVGECVIEIDGPDALVTGNPQPPRRVRPGGARS